MNKKTLFIIGGIILVIGLSIIIQNTSREDINSDNPEQVEVASNFYMINVDKLYELYNGEAYTLIYIGSPNCPNCEAMRPMAMQIADEFGINTHYLNLSDFGPNDHEKLSSIDAFFRNEQLGTPLFIVVGNNRVLEEMQFGATDRNGYIEFLERVSLK